MIHELRVAWTMTQVAIHVVVAFVLVGVIFPFRSPANCRRLIRWWSRRVLSICRMRLSVSGPPADPSKGGAVIERALAPEGIGAMLVMNHVSWLDIFVIHSVRPARFVAKAEIGRWPLLGFLVDRTGAVFIERGKRHAVREVNHRVAALLAGGDLIGMFPEGAVSAGDRLLPFHANLIQPAINAKAPIVVAGIRYLDARRRPTPATHYAGQVTLLQSIVKIARGGPYIADLHLISTVDGSTATRHEAARTARTLIGGALGFDDDAQEAREGLSSVIVIQDVESVSPGAGLAGTAPGTSLDHRDELL